MKKTNLQRLKMVSILLGLLMISCNFTAVMNGDTENGESLVLDYQPQDAAAVMSGYRYTSAQRDVLAHNGFPDRFLILFFKETGVRGEVENVRMEIWYYDRLGAEIVFRNGVLTKEQEKEPVQFDGMGRTAYNPDLFKFGMGMDQLTAVVGQSDFYRQPLNDELISEGDLIYFQGLVVGIENDQLRYVETLPIGNAGLPYQEIIENPLDQETVADELISNADQPASQATPTPEGPNLGEGLLVFTGIENNNYDIYTLDLATGEETRHTSTPALDAYPACPPNHSKIAFVSDSSGEQQVYSMDPDGGNLVKVTDFSGRKDFLTWMSNEEILFYDGQEEMAYIKVHITERWQETVNPESVELYRKDAMMGPDGYYLASAEAPDGMDTEIIVTNLENERVFQVTDNEGVGETRPVWSPDGRRILFTRHQGGNGDLWIYTFKNEEFVQITDTPGRVELSGCWLPAPGE